MATGQKTGRTTPPKPRTEDVLDDPTPAKDWKKRSGEGILVRVPSGNVAKIRTPGIEVFVTQGVIPNGLMPIIMDSMKRVGPPKDEDLVKMLEDKEALKQIIDLSSAVAVYCCIEPEVLPVPAEGEKRDPDALYVDEMDFNDRMFIFGVAVGGTSDLEKFREQQAAVMESLSDGEAVGEETE
jgi:hypothetical protein